MTENIVNTALNYTGSKFKLLPELLKEFDYTKDIFVDLFCGSFVVGSNVADRYKKVLANDIIYDLTMIHYNIIHDFDNFISDVKKLCVDKYDQDGFVELRSSYNSNKTPAKLYALLLCSTNNLMRFNQKFQYNQTFGKRSFNPSTEKKLNTYYEFITPFKDKIFFNSKPFQQIEIKKPSMVYVDSPYGRIVDENGNIMNKQISEAGYNCYFKKEDDIDLYNYILNLDKIGSSFMVSGLLEHDGNKSWMMNKLKHDGFRTKELEFDYNKVSRKGDKESIEVIIMNY